MKMVAIRAKCGTECPIGRCADTRLGRKHRHADDGGYMKRVARCRGAGFSASGQGLWVQAPGCGDVEQAGKVVIEPGNPVQDDDLAGAQRPVVIG